MLILKKVCLFLICLSVIIAIIFLVEPPKSWSEASLFQILVFFIPLLLSLTFLINLFLSFLPHSFILSLGLMVIIVLWSINLFNLISVPLTLALTLTCYKLFPKIRYPRKGLFKLTKEANIPKLTRLGGKNHE